MPCPLTDVTHISVNSGVWTQRERERRRQTWDGGEPNNSIPIQLQFSYWCDSKSNGLCVDVDCCIDCAPREISRESGDGCTEEGFFRDLGGPWSGKVGRWVPSPLLRYQLLSPHCPRKISQKLHPFCPSLQTSAWESWDLIANRTANYELGLQCKPSSACGVKSSSLSTAISWQERQQPTVQQQHVASAGVSRYV